MKLQTFHDLAISDAKIRSFLDIVGATRDSGMIDELKSAMMFLQEQISSFKKNNLRINFGNRDFRLTKEFKMFLAILT